MCFVIFKKKRTWETATSVMAHKDVSWSMLSSLLKMKAIYLPDFMCILCDGDSKSKGTLKIMQYPQWIVQTRTAQCSAFGLIEAKVI